MTGAIGRAVFISATLLSVAIFVPTFSFAVTGAANAQCRSGDYTCDYPGTKTVGTGQYATKVQCMRNAPCRDTTAQTTTNGKCVAFETCSVSKETDKDITGKPSGWQGEGDTSGGSTPSSPSSPSIPSIPNPGSQPPNADPTNSFTEPAKPTDTKPPTKGESILERFFKSFGSPSTVPGENTTDPLGMPTGLNGSETLQPDMNNNYGYGNTPEDNFGYGNQFQDGNTTFGPQVNPQPTDERTTFERISDFVTSPFKSTPDNYGYGNPNQTEPYNLPPSTTPSPSSPDDPRLPAHYDPQDPLFNNVGPSPTPKELADLNRQTETAYVNQIRANLDQLESEFKPLDARASELKSELERLAGGAKQTDKGLIFKTQQEVDTYNATQEKFQKAVEDRNAAVAKLNAAASDYNNMVEAYKVAPKFEYKSESGKYYDAFGSEYSTPSQAVQADRYLLKNAELGNQYFAQQKVVEQFEKNNSWFSRTFDAETRKAYLAEEAKLSKLKDAIKTNTAVTNYLGKGPDAALFAERLNTNPTTQRELVVQSLLYGQARDWDQNYSLAETIRTGSTDDLLRMGYIPPEGQDINRDDILKHYQFRSDLSAGRIAELTGAKEMTPQTLWSIATLTKSPEDFAAFNRAYLAGADTPMWQSILGEERYHRWAGEVFAYGQTSIDKFVTDAYKDASEKLTLTTPWQWGPGAASLLAGSIVGNVGEFVGLPTTQRSIEMLSQTPGEIAFSRGISGPMAFLDMTTLSAPKLAFTGTSLALREASLAAGEFRFGAGLTEGLSATEARVAARYAETVESNISGQVARGEMNPAAAQRAAYSELYEQIARSDPGRTGQVDNLMASLRSKMENLDITPPSGFQPRGATVADSVGDVTRGSDQVVTPPPSTPTSNLGNIPRTDTPINSPATGGRVADAAADVTRAPDPVVTPKPGAPTEVSNIPRAETPVTNPSTVSPVTNTARDTAATVAHEAAVAEALAEKAITTQQAAAARTYEEAFAARTKAEEIQTKLTTQIARELEGMAAQNVVRETDALRQLRQAAVEVQDLQTSLTKTMAREAVSSPPNISRSPYNEVVLSNKFGPLGRAQTLAANVFAESALSVRRIVTAPDKFLQAAIAALQIQVGGIEAGNAGTNALENLYRAETAKNTLTLSSDEVAQLTNTSPTITSPILSRISDAVSPLVNTAIPLSRFDATDILGNANPFVQSTAIQAPRGIGLSSEVSSAQQSFITYENGKVVFNFKSANQGAPTGAAYSVDLASLRISAVNTVPRPSVPDIAPAQVAPATAVTAPAPTQAAPVTTARYGVPNFFTNGIPNAAKYVWNSISPISGANAAQPGSRLTVQTSVPGIGNSTPVPPSLASLGELAPKQFQAPDLGLPAQTGDRRLLGERTPDERFVVAEDILGKLNQQIAKEFVDKWGVQYKPAEIVRVTSPAQPVSMNPATGRIMVNPDDPIWKSWGPEVMRWAVAHEIGHWVKSQVGVVPSLTQRGKPAISQKVELAGDELGAFFVKPFLEQGDPVQIYYFAAYWNEDAALARAGVKPPAGPALYPPAALRSEAVLKGLTSSDWTSALNSLASEGITPRLTGLQPATRAPSGPIADGGVPTAVSVETLAPATPATVRPLLSRNDIEKMMQVGPVDEARVPSFDANKFLNGPATQPKELLGSLPAAERVEKIVTTMRQGEEALNALWKQRFAEVGKEFSAPTILPGKWFSGDQYLVTQNSIRFNTAGSHYENFGTEAVLTALAHEYAHAVQKQMGILPSNENIRLYEMQADYIAGTALRSLFEKGLLKPGDEEYIYYSRVYQGRDLHNERNGINSLLGRVVPDSELTLATARVRGDLVNQGLLSGDWTKEVNVLDGSKIAPITGQKFGAVTPSNIIVPEGGSLAATLPSRLALEGANLLSNFSPRQALAQAWDSINPISSARAATPRVGNEVTTPSAPNGSPVSARTTFYGPGAGGTMQGGWETSRPNLEGIKNERGSPIPRTLDDVRLGNAGYVSLAVDPSNYGKFYNMGPVTYRSVLDKKIYTGDKLAAEASLKKADPNQHMTYAPQLEKVIGYAHDTGGAFMGRPDKFDVAVGDFRGWSAGDAMRFLTSSGQEYGGSKLNAWQQINAMQARQYIAAVTAKPPAAVAEMTPKPPVTKPVVETVRAANTATVPIVKKFTDRLTANLSRPVESVRAALTPRSIAVNPTSVAPQSPVETVIKNTKGEDIKVATDAKGDLQVNGKSYRELTDVDAITAVDKQIIQPRLIFELERLGHKVVVVPEPTGLPRSPFYIQKAAGELPVAPATNIVSHVALGDNAQSVIQFGHQPRFGQYLNASIYTDNCASGKCTVYIRDGLPRANHTARIDGRLPGAPDVFNWNSHGIELVARSETSVTAAGAQSVSDIAQAYRTAIGSDIRVVAHSDLNARDDSVQGLKNIEGQRGKAQALTDLQNIPRVALQLPQSPQPLTSAPRRLAEGGNKEFEAYTDLSVQVGRDTLMRQGYIFVPANIDATKPITIVMYMHGQLENGRSINAFSNTVERQRLAQQIRDSGMNAVLVAPNMDAIPAASGYFTTPSETTKFLAAAEHGIAQSIGIPQEALKDAPVVLVTYSGGYYPAGKILESGELNQRLSAILMLDSGYGTEANGFLKQVKNWSDSNPSGIVVSGYTVSTKPGNDALTNLYRNQRTGALTRTIVTSPLPAGEVIKPGTFAQIPTLGARAAPAAPHRNYVTDAGLTTAGVQPPIQTFLQMLPSVSSPAAPLVAQTKVPQVVKTMAERSIFAQPKSAAVQSDLGQVMAPTEAWMNARGREIVDAMGGSNGMLRPYTYDAAGVVRDLATGKVLEGFNFKPAGSAAARLDQIAKINGRPTNYKYNVVDGRLVALNELVRRSLGLQQLEFMSGVRPLDIGSNRHHTVVKGPDGSNMLITYAIDYAGGNTTIKAAIAAAASRAQTSLNAATGGKPFVPLSIGAQYPNTPNMVHMDVNPRPEARTWGGGQTSPLLSSIISFVARGSNTAENPVTHAVFAEALKQARLGISPTNPMVAIGAPTAPQVRQAPAVVAEAPDASLPTQPSGMTERFTARITANTERIAESATAIMKGAYENIRTALTPKTAPAPEVAVNADGDIRVTSPSTPNTHEMPTGVAPNPVTPVQPATPAGTPPVAQPAPVVTQPAAPVPTTPASTPVNADGDVRVTSPSTPNTHEMPAVAVVDSVPATQPVVSARVPFQEQVTTAASRAVDATRGWFDRSQKEFARLTEQLRARSAVQQSAQPAPNTIVGSDGDVIPVGQSSPNLHEMPTGVSAAKPVVSPSAAADTARIAREVAEGPASIDAAELARFAAIPPGPTKVTLAPTTKLTERVAETIRETTRPAVVVPSSEYHVALRSAADQLTKLRNAEAPLLKTLQDVTSQFSRTGNTDVLAAQLKAALPTYQEYDAVRKQTIAELQKLQKNPAVPAAEAKELGRTIGTLISRGSQIGNMLTESAFRSAVSLFDIHGSLSAHLTKVSVAAKVLNEAQRGSAGAIAHLAMAEETRLLAVMREAEKVAAAKPQTAAAVPTPAVSPAPTAPAPTAPVAAATDGSSFSLPKLISSVRENDVARPFFDTGVVLGAAGIALKATDVTARALKRATTAVANSWRAAFPRTASTPAAPATPARPTTPTAPTPTPTTPTTPTPSAPTPRAVLPSLGAMRSAASRASAALAPVARAAGVRAVAGTSAATKTVRNWVNARLARGNTTGTFAATPANPILRINPTNGRFEFIPPTTAGAAPTASLPGRFIQSAWGATKWCFSGFGKFTACALGGGAVYYFVVDPVMYAVSKDATAPAGTTQPQQNPNTQPKPGTQQPGTQQPGTQVPGTPGTTPGGETPDSGLGGLGGLGSLGNIAKSLPQLMQNLKNLFNPQQNTQPSTPTNIPTVKLDANPMTVVSGTTTRLSWSGENIANCTVIGPGSATLTRGGASGVITSPALATSTEFAVICSGTDGVSATNATVTVSVDGSSAPTIPVVLPPGVTKNASYSTAFNNPAGTTGSGTSAGTGSGNSTSGNGNNEAPVTPKTSGVDQYGNKVSAWCDPNQPIDSYTTCLCNLEPTGCYPWRQKQQ